MRNFTESEKGSAFIVALVAIIALSGASAAFLSITLYRNKEAAMSHDRLVTLYIAEAGVSASIAELSADSGNGIDYDSDGLGDVSGNFAGGNYSVTAVDDGNDVWTLTSTGTYKDETRRIEVVAARKIDSPFTHAAFGGTSLDMSGVTLCDSYDSDNGSYASQVSGDHAGENGTVASNGDISVGSNAYVWGDATPGPDGSVTGAENISGLTTPADEATEIDPYIYTPVGSSLGILNSTTTLSSGTYRYSSIKLTGGKTLTLGENAGDEVTLYIDGIINVGGGSTIQIYYHDDGDPQTDDSAKVVIHHGSDKITFGGNGVVNDSGIPANFILYSATTSEVKCSGTSAFFGAVYAPNAPIKLTGTSEFFGSAVGASVTVSGTFDLHYDEALARLDSFTSEEYYQQSWRELTP